MTDYSQYIKKPIYAKDLGGRSLTFTHEKYGYVDYCLDVKLFLFYPPDPKTWDSDVDYYGDQDVEFEIVSCTWGDENGDVHDLPDDIIPYERLHEALMDAILKEIYEGTMED